MRTFAARVSVLILFGLCPAIIRGEEKQTPEKGAESKVPEKSEKWVIDFDGYAGTPGDRSWFKVKVLHDGVVEFTKKRKGPWGKPHTERLSAAEIGRVHAAVVKIIKDHDPNARDGKVMDGWHVDLKITGDASSAAASYSGQWKVKDISPAFKDIDSLLNEKFKDYDFPE